ncbi:MAG: hypothetical protein ACKVJU_23740 [Verrucomicrobiales bacterium]
MINSQKQNCLIFELGLLLSVFSDGVEAQNSGFDGGFDDRPDAKIEATDEQKLCTNTYTVPPTFITEVFGNGGDGSSSRNRRTALQIFEEVGIKFGPGARVFYGQRTCQIIVCNTAAEMEKVEVFLSEINREGIAKQIHVFVEFIEVEAALYHD